MKYNEKFLLLSIVFCFLLLFSTFICLKRSNILAACYTDCCVAWNDCCSMSGGGGCVDYCNEFGQCFTECNGRPSCNSCCTANGQCEVECPCDDSCNGSCTLPSCPSGYDRTNPNNLCTSDTKSISCSYSNGCGNPCSINASCYRLETNQTPSAPTSLTIIIDGQSYTLSPNSTTPTRVKYPSPLNDVNISIPYVAPDISVNRGLGYIFRANNYGVDNEWVEWTDCTNPRPEDFCKESTTNTTTFTPSSLTPVQVLKQNSQGNIGGLYYSINRCDDNRLYSSVLQTYYKVDNIPVICDPSKEICVECDPRINDCTPIIINTTPETETTSKGCKTTTHTGKEANNPLPIEIQAYDKDGNNEIQSAVIWFSESGNTPNFPQLVSAYTYTDTSEIGIMIRKNGSSWTNIPYVYATNPDGSFAKITNNTIKNSSGENIITINNIEINEGTKITISFDITFLNNINRMYNVKSIVLDSYMFLDNGTIDLSYMKKYFDWGVDLVNPTIDDFHKDIVTPKTFNLSWNVTDNISKITNFVINAYRTDTGVNGTTSDITMQGKNNIRLNGNGENVPDEQGLGLITDSNTWQFNNLSSNPYSQTKLVNINGNELGTITLHGSAYDQACNFTTTSSLGIRLDPWYVTKGGILYSKGYLGIAANEMLPNTDQSIFRNFIPSEIDKGTEVLTSAGQFIANLKSTSTGAVRAISIYDSNQKEDFWFNYLVNKLNVIKSTFKEITTISQCNTNEICYIHDTEAISIPSNTICKGKVLIVSDENINISPNIESGIDKTSGCIFLAGKDIVIEDGEYISQEGSVKYDYIDSFLIAEGGIEIEYADGGNSVRDGLEINGGIIATENRLNADVGIYLRRNLRLFNYTNPTMLINYDYKYVKMAEKFFGRDSLLYKQEVGAKGL